MSVKKTILLFGTLFFAAFSVYSFVRPVFAAVGIILDGDPKNLTRPCASLSFRATPSTVTRGVSTPVQFSWVQRQPGLIDGGGTGIAEQITDMNTRAVVYSSPTYQNPVTVPITINTNTVFRLEVNTSSGCETTPIDVLVAASPAVCGNGIVEAGEACDNGALNGACPATCSATCTINSCSGQFDQASGTISVRAANPGIYSIPVIVTGKDSATGKITSKSSVMMNIIVGASTGPIIQVSSVNAANTSTAVSASWNLFGAKTICGVFGLCSGTSQVYSNVPITNSNLSVGDNYTISPGTAPAGYAFAGSRVQVARAGNGFGDLGNLFSDLWVKVARAWSSPPSNPPSQSLNSNPGSCPGSPPFCISFIILWDPVAQLGVAPTSLSVTNVSPNGTITVSNPGSPGSVLNWSAAAPSYGAGASGWLTLSSSAGPVAAGAPPQNITATANTSTLSLGSCTSASPCTATVRFTGTYPVAGGFPAPAKTPGGASFVDVTITLTLPGVSVSVTPPTAILQYNQTQQFTAAVAGSANKNVTWSVVGGGSISASGLYTAPAASSTATITATSEADPTRFGTATAYTISGRCDFFRGTPSTIVIPGSSTLTWSCLNVSSCKITDQSGATIASGLAASSTAASPVKVSPAKTTTYALTCNNIGLSATITTTVDVRVNAPGIHEVNP